MSFVLYDVIFMIIFTLAAVIFIYTRKHNLQKQGILYLYRTQLGIKFIDWTSAKYKRILRPLEYVVVACGYFLMIGAVWLVITTVYIYVKSPFIAKIVQAPPVFPIFPYFTEFFNLDSFFPPFYFTYFAVVIAIIAVSHEFAHGIFARLNKVKIHSTGFAFMGPFLGAFVEQDEKQMNKAPKFSQLSILAAGTFANIIMTILFGLLMWAFFASAFSPAGVNFNTYSVEVVPFADLSLDGVPLSSIHDIKSNESLITLSSLNNKTYYTSQLGLQTALKEKPEQIMLYEDSPALRARLSGAITSINGKPTTSYEQLKEAISSQKPGNNITIKTIKNNKITEYNVQLAEKDNKAYLGIGLANQQSGGAFSWLSSFISKIKNPEIYYESKIGDFGLFIYNLLWWIVILNILVAFTNMLPVGIFDGGRFFYLTIWGLTGNEKAAKNSFKASTWIMLALIAVLMLKWIFTFF